MFGEQEFMDDYGDEVFNEVFWYENDQGEVRKELETNEPA